MVNVAGGHRVYAVESCLADVHANGLGIRKLRETSAGRHQCGIEVRASSERRLDVDVLFGTARYPHSDAGDNALFAAQAAAGGIYDLVKKYR